MRIEILRYIQFYENIVPNGSCYYKTSINQIRFPVKSVVDIFLNLFSEGACSYTDKIY